MLGGSGWLVGADKPSLTFSHVLQWCRLLLGTCCLQLCIELDRRLRQVYNRPGQAPLVLDAHVISGRALEQQEGTGEPLVGAAVANRARRKGWRACVVLYCTVLCCAARNGGIVWQTLCHHPQKLKSDVMCACCLP